MTHDERVYRSAVLGTRAEHHLESDPTRALEEAREALRVWPKNPDAEAVLVRAALGDLYTELEVDGFVRDVAVTDAVVVVAAKALVCLERATGRELWTLDPEGDAVVALCLEAGLVGMLFGEIRPLDVATGELGEAVATLPGTVEALSLVGGRLVAVGGGRTVAVDLETHGVEDVEPGEGPAPRAIVRADGRVVAGGRALGVGEAPRVVRLDGAGRYLAAAGSSGPVRVFDLAAPRLADPILRHNHYNLRFVALGPGGEIALARVEEIEVFSGGERTVLQGHERAAIDLVFADGLLYSAGDDCTLRAWSVSEGRCVRVWTQPDSVVEGWRDEGWTDGVHTMSRRSSRMAFVAPGPGNGLILSGAPDGRLQVWPVDGGGPVGALSAEPAGRGKWPDVNGRIERAVWLDGVGFAARDRERVYLGRVGTGWTERLDAGESLRSFAVALDGLRLVTVHGQMVRVWSLESKRVVHSLGFPLPIMAVAFRADGGLVALGRRRKELAWFRLDPRGRVHRTPWPLSEGPDWVRFAPDGETAWVAVSKRGVFRLPVTGVGALALCAR